MRCSIVAMLNSENRQLFGDQVRDHIAKLNDLMERGSGEQIRAATVQKSCFAGRLLEGSTRMLGLGGWSRSLTLLRELLERAATIRRPWDEQLSQIVSEILEAEEQAVEAILSEGTEGVEDDRFEGFSQELELLISEPFAEAPGETEESVRIEVPAPTGDAGEPEEETAGTRDEPVERVSPETGEPDGSEGDAGGYRGEPGNQDAAIPEASPVHVRSGLESAEEESLEEALFPRAAEATSVMPANEFATISRLQGSLCLINDRLEECLLEACGSDSAVRDLEIAIGECEFFISMLSGMLGRIGENRKPLRSKVSSGIVMDSLKDFLEVHKRIRNWK
ncbi:MAG: hypothetical protein PHQ19_07410, partial [Candidatus Krumholzibacteria bacterium]|nr:hypothetical protein [Candidatus Krumholzibacteria bacterium]